jgi:alkylated DNA repair dioxygenase AlkB
MQSLFADDPLYPPGFTYVPDFLDQTEEGLLIKEVSKTELHTFVFQGYEAKRRVASFGYDYSFDKRTLTAGRPIPPAFRPLIEKVSAYTGLDVEQFAELLITEYPPGSVINWHRDAPPFDLIAGISLLSDCVFRFRPHEKTKQTRGSIRSLTLRRRSLYIISADARTQWQHATLPVKERRYSITLRTLRVAS